MRVSSFDESTADFCFQSSLSSSAPVIALIAFIALLLGAGGASAEMEFYFDSDVGGFVSDTATDDFVAAIDNQPTEHTSFDKDRDGNDFLDLVGPGQRFSSVVDGSEFSYRLVLSSPDMLPTEHVELVIEPEGDAGGDAQAAPQTHAGKLEISFLPPYATAVGIGPVALGFVEIDAPGGELDMVTVYDPEGALLYSVFYTEPDDLPDSPFIIIEPPVKKYTFIGFKTDNDDRIGRVVLQGHVREQAPYHLIGVQDLQFVPEPGAGAQVFAALATLWAVRRARRSLS